MDNDGVMKAVSQLKQEGTSLVLTRDMKAGLYGTLQQTEVRGYVTVTGSPTDIL